MFDTWIQWQPLSNIRKSYNLENFITAIQRFELVLSPTNQENEKIRIIFDEGAWAYRHSKRDLRDKTLDIIRKKEGPNFLNWTFFKVINSTYLETLSKNSCEIYTPQEFVHFVFLTQNDLLEIVDTTGADPLVEFTKK